MLRICTRASSAFFALSRRRDLESTLDLLNTAMARYVMKRPQYPQYEVVSFECRPGLKMVGRADSDAFAADGQ